MPDPGMGEAPVCLLSSLPRTVIRLTVPGAARGDPRPGFLACEDPGGGAAPVCGIPGPVTDPASHLTNWHFYPFPANDAHTVGYPVGAQEYQCVGNGKQLWTFHFDTHTFSSGCTVPPPIEGMALRPCDAFLYEGMYSDPPLLGSRGHGHPAFCGLIGTTVVGVVQGNPQPGLLVCAPSPGLNAEARSKYCGFWASKRPVPASVWAFVPLPVAHGPVDSATFDTAAGSACLTVGGQRFTFNLRTMAVAPGCATTP